MIKYAHRFPVTSVWHQYFPTQDFLRTCMKDYHPEMWEWLEQQELFGAWKLTFKAGDSEIDTGFIQFHIYIAYEDENDAFLHRMRW